MGNYIFTDNIFIKMSIFFSVYTKNCYLFKGMEFHEELHNLGAKEGLKGRKLNKATESFAWNITVLKVSKILTLLPLFFHSSLQHIAKHQ